MRQPIFIIILLLLSTHALARTYTPVVRGAGSSLKATVTPTWEYPGLKCEVLNQKITYQTRSETCSYPLSDRGRVYSCKKTDLQCVGPTCPSRACRVASRLPTTYIPPTPARERPSPRLPEPNMVKLPGSIPAPKPGPSYKK